MNDRAEWGPARDLFGPVFETVSQLTARIKGALRAQFRAVAVRGELSNVRPAASGHIYFKIKDEKAVLSAVIWKGAARQLAFDLTDGLEVRAIGEITVYEPQGNYQIVVQEIEPEGIGALDLAFRQRRAKLAAEGLFDPDRKRPLPRFPRRIVFVTSPTGAAVRDLLQVTGRRWKATAVLIAPTRVQGEGADREVVAALALANQVRDADLIVVARGGGSQEDLWTFNEEIVVRAIAQSRLPVISAIGHEIDVTLADLAADHRALTPSEAGETCVPDAREVAQGLDHLAERLHLASQGRLRDARAQLDYLAERLHLAGQGRLRDARARLDRLAEHVHLAQRGQFDQRRRRLERFAATLEALSPLAVLARGYSLTYQEDGTTLVRSVHDVQPGQILRTRLGDGEIPSRVGPSS